MVIPNSITIIKRNMSLTCRNCLVIGNNFLVSQGIQMERSLLILIPVLHHCSPVRLLAIQNIKESTGFLHHWLNKMANQYSTRMENHHVSPLNRCRNHSNRLTPGTHSVSLITPMTYFPLRSHYRMSTETTSAQ